jgi:hypothetical protein
VNLINNLWGGQAKDLSAARYTGYTYKTKLPHLTPNHESFSGDLANNIWGPSNEYKDGTKIN